MREIKFRAWDTKCQRWVKSNHLGDSKKMTVRNTKKGFRFLNEKESDFIFCQFTGLKDKNGKEIYQDDIVNIDGLNVRVDWYNGAWTVEYFTSPKRSYLSTFDESDIEIIGNVWESPELLK